MPSEEQTTGAQPQESLHSVDELKCLDIDLETMVIHPYHERVLAVVRIDGQRYGIPLEGYEATLLGPAIQGCGEFMHIPTTHQLVLGTHAEYGRKLQSITIESMVGDILYARMAWLDHKNRWCFNLCSAADALIYSCLAPAAKLKIVQRVLDALDPMDEWSADQEIMEE